MAMNNSLAEVHPELVSEWSEKNLPLTPDDITFGSNKKVWWRGACGHEWQTSVKARSNGEKCPICSGARVIAGINDLATLEPLSDEVIMKLNDQLNMIRDNIGTEQEISITYFVPDDKKSGGAYLTHSGIVKKIDEFERKLIMQDETVIPTEQISVIQGEMFKGLYE